MPVLVCISSTSGRATGYAFPIANWLSARLQRFRKPEAFSRNRTVGHVPKLVTHRIDSHAADRFDLCGMRDRANGDGGRTRQLNPFWVVSATPAVIDGHNGIWQRPFMAFLHSLLRAKAATTRAGGSPAARGEAGRELPPFLKDV